MTLAELIERRKESAKSMQAAPVDWRLRRDKWLTELDGVLRKIESWLLAGGVSADEMKRFELEISEEALGRYSATGLSVCIGDAVVTFRPMGSVLIGACGRIDVTSDQRGTPSVKLIAEFVPDAEPSTQRPSCERDWVWRAYPGHASDGGFFLSEEGLARVLAVVLGEGSLS